MKFILVGLLTVLSEFSCEERFQNRVYNGHQVFITQYPYLARIEITRGNQNILCSGSLISHHYLLTAAHCVREGTDTVTIRLGIDNVNQFGFNQTCSQCWTIYPRYHHNNTISVSNKNDIFEIPDVALIRLQTQIEFNDRISPIQLPSYADAEENLMGKTGTVVGWGRTNIFDGKTARTKAPVAADAVVLDQESCKSIFSAAKEPYDPIDQFCTSHMENGACPGDSGGPFIIDQKQLGVACAVTNRKLGTEGAVEPCDSNYGGSYTNMAKFKFLRWIEENSDVKIGIL